MALLIIGVLLALGGGALVFFGRKSADTALQMKATETSQIGALRQLVGQIRAELGGGPSQWAEHVELKGRVVCERPLRAELSGMDAAVVRTTVTRDVEELREDRDSEGNVRTRWVKRSETVQSNTLEAPFAIDDGTGTLEVRPSGADYTLQDVVDRFEPPNAVEQGSSLVFGSMRFGMSGSFGPIHGRRRVIGYRFRESILPLGAPVYALGQASDTAAGFLLGKPADKEQRFVISTKSEEEMVAAAESSAKWMGYGGIGLIAVGALMAIAGLISAITG